MNIEEKVVFSVVESEVGPIVTLGIPQGAWEYMRDGKTHTFDLTKIGLPLKLMLFGAASHDAAMKELEGAAKASGAAMLDERRRDFSIEPAKKN